MGGDGEELMVELQRFQDEKSNKTNNAKQQRTELHELFSPVYPGLIDCPQRKFILVIARRIRAPVAVALRVDV